jgi:hypothetical protein
VYIAQFTELAFDPEIIGDYSRARLVITVVE